MLAEEARSLFGEAVVLVSGGDAALTRAWESVQVPGRIVVGTPRLALWHIVSLDLAVVLEENRRAMKERHTPTVHVREVMRTRSLLEGFTLAFLGPTPSTENLASGAEVTRVGTRAWPLVEVVDRSEEPPGSGFLSGRVIAALAATVRSGARAFVFTHRRAGGSAMRCVRCRALRSCPICGSPLGRGASCRRCGADAPSGCLSCGGVEFEELGTIPARLVAEINGRLGRDAAAVHPAPELISVGTERDLAALPLMALVVAADIDGLLLAPGFRATEEALRLLARLGNALERGPGRRMMIQTAHPSSELVATLTRGDPIPYLEKVLVERARDGLPPATEMLAVEIREHIPEGVEEELASLGGVSLLGPLEIEQGLRWLLAGDLGKARLALRGLVGRWREAGATVRIDADPIDL
jgi:primosomal protein N' (replication factor Y)